MLVFLVSATAKLGSFGGFVAAIRQVRLVPGRWPRPIARTVVAAEGAVAGLLLLPAGFAVAGFVLAILLCVVFGLMIELSVRRGIRVPCPCFGASADFLNRRHLVRNGILVAVAATGLAGFDLGRLAVAEIALGVVVAVFVAAVVIRFDDVVAVVLPRPAVKR